jgi:hypothetical protein
VLDGLGGRVVDFFCQACRRTTAHAVRLHQPILCTMLRLLGHAPSPERRVALAILGPNAAFGTHRATHRCSTNCDSYVSSGEFRCNSAFDACRLTAFSNIFLALTLMSTSLTIKLCSFGNILNG